MHRTAWTKNNTSLPSDRIKPSYSNQQNNNNQKGKGRSGTASPKDPPKSKQVRKLEGLLNSLKASSNDSAVKDPKGGCFCQAREHALSTYTPICLTCGLVLCTLNLPHFSCPSPSCNSILLKGVEKESIIIQLETQIADILAKEAVDRERAIEEARREAGAFPALSSASQTLAQVPQQHKVLSLNSKTKKVTVSSYSTPSSSRPASRAASEKEEEEAVIRVPPPPEEVAFVKGKPNPERVWENLRGGSAKYVRARTDEKENKTQGNKSLREGKGKTGGAVVHQRLD